MPLAQFGQYPAPQHVIAHLSDTHLLADGALQFEAIDTEANVLRAQRLLADVEMPPQAIIVSGDLADRGERAAYRRLKDLVDAAAEQLDAAVIWAIGNHDDRAAFSEVLFGETSTEPQDRVHELEGLRVVCLDTTVPGYHHGELERRQLDWLGEVLSETAAHGTVLVMHHPPLPIALDRPSQVIELDGQMELAEVIRASDIRAIVSGHMHYPTYGVFAGVPVFTASAICSTMDLAGSDRTYGVRDAAQAIAMLHLFEAGAGGIREAPITHTVLPLVDAPHVIKRQFAEFATLDSMSHGQRRELLSKHHKRDGHDPTFDSSAQPGSAV